MPHNFLRTHNVRGHCEWPPYVSINFHWISQAILRKSKDINPGTLLSFFKSLSCSVKSILESFLSFIFLLCLWHHRENRYVFLFLFIDRNIWPLLKLFESARLTLIFFLKERSQTLLIHPCYLWVMCFSAATPPGSWVWEPVILDPPSSLPSSDQPAPKNYWFYFLTIS